MLSTEFQVSKRCDDHDHDFLDHGTPNSGGNTHGVMDLMVIESF